MVHVGLAVGVCFVCVGSFVGLVGGRRLILAVCVVLLVLLVLLARFVFLQLIGPLTSPSKFKQG